VVLDAKTDLSQPVRNQQQQKSRHMAHRPRPHPQRRLFDHRVGDLPIELQHACDGRRLADRRFMMAASQAAQSCAVISTAFAKSRRTACVPRATKG
jgi:hypothetical protein